MVRWEVIRLEAVPGRATPVSSLFAHVHCARPFPSGVGHDHPLCPHQIDVSWSWQHDEVSALNLGHLPTRDANLRLLHARRGPRNSVLRRRDILDRSQCCRGLAGCAVTAIIRTAGACLAQAGGMLWQHELE